MNLVRAASRGSRPVLAIIGPAVLVVAFTSVALVPAQAPAPAGEYVKKSTRSETIRATTLPGTETLKSRITKPFGRGGSAATQRGEVVPRAEADPGGKAGKPLSDWFELFRSRSLLLALSIARLNPEAATACDRAQRLMGGHLPDFSE